MRLRFPRVRVSHSNQTQMSFVDLIHIQKKHLKTQESQTNETKQSYNTNNNNASLLQLQTNAAKEARNYVWPNV